MIGHVTAAIGLVDEWAALWALPIAFMTGLCFGAMALAVTAFSESYDFFMYYLTLFVTPVFYVYMERFQTWLKRGKPSSQVEHAKA